MHEAFSRPMPYTEGKIAVLPSPEEVNGNEVLFEVTPPQLADYRKLLRPLDDDLNTEPEGPGVEHGLITRYFEEEIRKETDDGKAYWFTYWNKEFDKDPEKEWQIFIGRKSIEDCQAEAAAARDLLTQLQSIINSSGSEDLTALRSHSNLFGSLGRAGLTVEAGRQFGEFITKLTEQREMSMAARQAAFEQIAELIELEAKAKIEIAKGGRTHWDQLSEVTKGLVKQAFFQYWWKREEGTFRRNAELKVLYTHAGFRGGPGWWYEGQERAIYGGLLGWRILNRKLKQLDPNDPKNAREIADYRAKMVGYEKIIQYGSSATTGRLEHQTQFEPAGTDQISLESWEEMVRLIDRIRANPDDKNSQAKRAFVYASATQEKASWENLFRKQDIYFHYAVARNALKRLTRKRLTRKRLTRTEGTPNDPISETGRQEFYDKIVYVAKAKDAQKPEYKGKIVFVNPELAVKPLDKIKRDFEFYKSELALLTTESTKLQQAHDETKAELKSLGGDDGRGGEIERLEEEIAKFTDIIKTAGAGGQRGGNQTQSRSLNDMLVELRNELQTAKTQYKALAKKKDNYVKEGAEKTKLATDVKGTLEDLEDRIKNWDDTTWQARETAKAETAITTSRYHDQAEFEQALAEDKNKRYNELVEKLERYINDRMTKDDLKIFYKTGESGYFTPDEVEILAKLTGLSKHKNKQGVNHLVVKNLVEQGTDDYEDGDFVFINLNAVGEQVDRLSPEILTEIFNPKNKGRFKEVHDLMEKFEDKNKNKIVIAMAYPLEDNVAGGIDQREQGYGGGRAFNHARAAELKDTFGWNDNDLFMHWLDDLNIQRELGVRPEEVLARFTYWRARHHQLRRDHFKAEDGWTIIHDTIPTGTSGFFETMIRRLFDAGYTKLTSEDYRSSPFYNDPLKTNERATTIVDRNLNQKVIFRDENLSENPETNAPATLVQHLYRSIVAELDLYSQRSQLGGQVTAERMGVTDPSEIGAFIQANLDLIEAKRMAAKSIFYDLGLSAEERLDKLLAFRRTGMKNLSYDILDENGNININASNRELWKYYNGVAQYYGKLNRDKREAEFVYAQTVTNPHATPEMIESAEAVYIDKLQTWRNFGMKQQLLGLQATGQLKGKTAKEIGKIIAGRHAKETVEASARMQEQLMRAHFFYDEQYSPPVINATRRLVGKLFKNRVTDYARWLGHHFGAGDRFVSEISQDVVRAMTRRKFDDQIFRRLAAHMAYNIRTGYQNDWGGVLSPADSTVLYPGSPGIAQLFGEDVESPGVHLSPTGRSLLNAVEYRVADDIGDAIDRTLRVNMSLFINAAKNSGWDIDQLMYTYQHARMNDSQRVVDAPWSGVAGTNPHLNRQYNMYATRKEDRAAISMVDSWLLQLLRERLRRPFFNPLPGSAPADTRYVPLNRSDPPMGEQYQHDLAAAV